MRQPRGQDTQQAHPIPWVAGPVGCSMQLAVDFSSLNASNTVCYGFKRCGRWLFVTLKEHWGKPLRRQWQAPARLVRVMHFSSS